MLLPELPFGDAGELVLDPFLESRFSELASSIFTSSRLGLDVGESISVFATGDDAILRYPSSAPDFSESVLQGPSDTVTAPGINSDCAGDSSAASS